jgi:hypothetical protein
MKTCGGAGVIAPTFLIPALHGGELLATHSGRFTPSAHWIGGWVGLAAGMDANGEEKKLIPLPGIKPRQSCS